MTQARWREGCVHGDHHPPTAFQCGLSFWAGFLLLVAAQAYAKDPHLGKESNSKLEEDFEFILLETL